MKVKNNQHDQQFSRETELFVHLTETYICGCAWLVITTHTFTLSLSHTHTHSHSLLYYGLQWEARDARCRIDVSLSSSLSSAISSRRVVINQSSAPLTSPPISWSGKDVCVCVCCNARITLHKSKYVPVYICLCVCARMCVCVIFPPEQSSNHAAI